MKNLSIMSVLVVLLYMFLEANSQNAICSNGQYYYPAVRFNFLNNNFIDVVCYAM